MDFANAALFGADPQERIVAVEFDGTAAALVFVREENGATRVEDHGFRPCAWVPAGTPDAAPLAGGHFFGALR
ncbi:MAG: hypothetical protein PHC88_16330, partial [Terrimicrobiaceae bacterium]|nr:hypothetical protein [Terrimicrobiaceae bacterium]